MKAPQKNIFCLKDGNKNEKNFVFIIAIAFMGCHSQKEIERLENELVQSQEEIERLKIELSAAKSKTLNLSLELREALQKIKALEDGQYPYSGFWVDVVDGEVNYRHVIYIEKNNNRADVIDLQIETNEIIQNSFNVAYQDGIIVWDASPLSFTFEFYKASDLDNKPDCFIDSDSILFVTQYLDFEGDSETLTDYYLRVDSSIVTEMFSAYVNP